MSNLLIVTLRVIVATVLSSFIGGFGIFLIPTLILASMSIFFGCRFHNVGKEFIGVGTQICTNPSLLGLIGVIINIGVFLIFLCFFGLIYKNFKGKLK